MRRTPRTVLAGALAAVLALLAAACGASAHSATNATTPGAAPTTTSAPATRIVSLSPTATEMLFAIGAGRQVVAVDDQSNYPPDAPKTDLSGLKPNVEAIAAKKPDLVVISNDIDNLVAQLSTLKIKSLLLPAAATLDDTYEQIQKLGDTTGHTSEARNTVATMKSRIDQAVQRAPKPSRPLRYYHELDNTLYTVTSKTFVGQLYALVGLQNVADAADKDGSGYPQLSAEYLVQQSPDIVFLADTKCCGQTAATFAARPGFAPINAVRNHAVITLDDDVASRWGPRTPDLLDQVVDALSKLATPVGR